MENERDLLWWSRHAAGFAKQAWCGSWNVEHAKNRRTNFVFEEQVATPQENVPGNPFLSVENGRLPISSKVGKILDGYRVCIDFSGVFFLDSPNSTFPADG